MIQFSNLPILSNKPLSDKCLETFEISVQFLTISRIYARIYTTSESSHKHLHFILYIHTSQTSHVDVAYGKMFVHMHHTRWHNTQGYKIRYFWMWMDRFCLRYKWSRMWKSLQESAHT